MTRRILWTEAPGKDGIFSDSLEHQLSQHQISRGQDAIKPRGLVRQRRGWAYSGSVAAVSDNLVTVYRNKFVLANATREVVGDDDGDLFINNPAGSGTAIFAGTVPYLARAVYNDELIFCATDGLTPMRRYAGAASVGTSTDLVGTFTLNEATITAIAFSATPDKGIFVATVAIPSSFKTLLTSSTAVTLKNIRAGANFAMTILTSLTGLAYPAVSIYEAGTATWSGGGAAAGFGTAWSSGVTILEADDEKDTFLITPPTGVSEVSVIVSVTNDTTLSIFSNTAYATKSSYHILRQCPFKDVANHKGRFCGTGVKQHKTRVYLAPRGWDMSLPPGFTPPWDPALVASGYQSSDPLDFMLDYVDVPAPDDDDEMVALLSSDNPLIPLGRGDAWGVYGAEPPFDVTILPNGHGAGCIDIRSAWNLGIGPVWASEHGVLAFIGGQVVNLTEDRINHEWRELIHSFDFASSDYCTIGEADGVLIVSMTTDGGSTFRSWNVYPFDDAGRLNPCWQSRLTNVKPRFMFSSKVPGEKEALLAVSDSQQGRVLDYAPLLDGSGTARDADGTSPALELDFPSNLPRLAGADVDERLLEVVVEANLTDSGGASSTLGGTVVSSQRLDADASPLTTNLGSMASKTTDLTKPYKHKIGVKAGLHQVKLAKSATQTTETVTEISRLGVSVRRSGGRPI